MNCTDTHLVNVGGRPSPNSHAEILKPNMMVLGDRAFRGDCITDEISAFIKETPSDVVARSLGSEKGPHPTMLDLISDFQPLGP